MTLQGKFDQFRRDIEPTENERNKIITTHNHLRQNVLQKLTYVKNTILTGSYKRKTIIRPMNDVDIFVILDYKPGAFNNPTPQTILNRIKSDLSLTYPNTKIRQDKPCITLDFNHCKFELTPVIEGASWGTNFYEIPNSSNINNWQKVDNPDILGEKLSRANSQKPMLVPLIKMMKKCKEKNNIKSPKSFEMEILAINQLGYINSYREGIINLLQIYGWLDYTSINSIKSKNDQEFATYCRNTLFGNEFPN